MVVVVFVVIGVFAILLHSTRFGQHTYAIGGSTDALSRGIETIYQDLARAENLNVYSNIFLGREITKKFARFLTVIDHEHPHAEARKVLDRLEIKIPSLKSCIKSLSGGQRRGVQRSGQ